MEQEIGLGDIVHLKKPHPCGSYDWEVVGLGADVNLRCLKCNHRVSLEHRLFERRVKKFKGKK